VGGLVATCNSSTTKKPVGPKNPTHCSGGQKMKKLKAKIKMIKMFFGDNIFTVMMVGTYVLPGLWVMLTSSSHRTSFFSWFLWISLNSILCVLTISMDRIGRKM
jgi:hypothetical protein